MQGTYEQLAATLPAVAFEFNPLTHARSPLLRQETNLAALNAAIARFASTLDDLANAPAPPRAVDMLCAVTTQVHEDISAINQRLRLIANGEDAPSNEAPAEPAAFPSLTPRSDRDIEFNEEPGPGQRLVRAVIGVRLVVVDIAKGLGLSPQPLGIMSQPSSTTP